MKRSQSPPIVSTAILPGKKMLSLKIKTPRCSFPRPTKHLATTECANSTLYHRKKLTAVLCHYSVLLELIPQAYVLLFLKVRSSRKILQTESKNTIVSPFPNVVEAAVDNFPVRGNFWRVKDGVHVDNTSHPRAEPTSPRPQFSMQLLFLPVYASLLAEDERKVHARSEWSEQVQQYIHIQKSLVPVG